MAESARSTSSSRGLLIQVKGGQAKDLTRQIVETAATTGQTVIGYAPGMADAAWKNAMRMGLPIAQTIDDLLDIVKELR